MKKTRSSAKIVYRFKGKNMALKVFPHRLPNNCWVNLQMITHPGAVCIVPFLRPGQIILLRQYRPVLKTYIYELPAGTMDDKEDPLTCARRELKEETGYSARRLIRKGKIYPVPGYSDELIFIYKAEGLTFAGLGLEPDEVIEIRPMTVAKIKTLFRKGKIIDAKTICALTFCRIL
jgi:ADP-ribose pyrophosphatase